MPRFVGVVERRKGRYEFRYDAGSFLLEAHPEVKPGWCVLTGTPRDGATLRVEQVLPLQREPAGLPEYIVHDVGRLHAAAKLRRHARRYMEDELGADEITLPTVWSQSEEYGQEEFTLRHAKLADDLKLLQSSEFPLIQALARGMDNLYTFGRCYRHEDDEDVAGNYLLEFEQLVIARCGTSLDEMVRVAQSFVIDVARHAGVNLEDRHFSVLGPRDVRPDATFFDPDPAESLTMFTIPAMWGVRARGVLLSRLAELGAQVEPLGSSTGATDGIGAAGEEVRLAIVAPRERADSVARALDIASSMVLPEDAASVDVVSLQWNPTWVTYPTVAWRDGERIDSSYPIRSITSARRASSRGEVNTDAELHLAGSEIIHVREYATAEQFRLNLAQSGLDESAARRRYEYLIADLERSPGGAVGIFIGWERFAATLLGKSGASAMLAFPRAGTGRRL